jgi:hypothetical protein
MKYIYRLLIFLYLFIISLLHSFAFDANINIDKTNLNINDILNLRLEINSSEWWEVKIKEIKWIENFQIIWQSQSQSSSTQIVVVNWKTQSKAVSTLNLDLVLKPRKNWDFTIWPAILESGTWVINTNSVKIKVKWTSIPVLWNTKLWVKNNNSSNKTINNTLQENREKQENINLVDYKNNNDLYLLILVLILIAFWFYYLLKNDNFEFKKEFKEDNSFQKNENSEKEDSKIDFEEKQEIIYPEISDSDFIKKAEEVLRKKIAKKFKIKNIDSLTFEEIQKQVWDKLELNEIFDMINKAKYSNIITDYSKILEFIKNI